MVMIDEKWMKEALDEARLAQKENEVPVGAVIVKDGVIIGRGHNEREAKNAISSHAEIEAILDAEKKLGSWSLEGATLYVTLEPCLMCAGAILQSRLHRVVYGVNDPKMGAIKSHYYVFDDPSYPNRPLVNDGCLEKESQALLESFFLSIRKG